MATSKSKQYKLNREIEKMLDKKGMNRSLYTKDDLDMLKKYSGYGGLGNEQSDDEDQLGSEILYEYYTPDDVIEVMWRLLLKHGFVGGKVLEPSCGIGRFFEIAPQTPNPIEFVGYEISKYSSMIASILYPNAIVHQKYFEQRFIKYRSSLKKDVEEVFDAVIGNPPYGSLKGKSGGLYMAMGEKKYTQAQRYEDYFILRALDTLKPGGVLCYIVGAAQSKTFLASGSNKAKESIAVRADLVEAYKMPNGIFTYTDVVSEIVVFKKKDR